MPKTVTDKSQMMCSLGTAPSKIQVTSQSFKKINNELIATEADKEGLSNIPTFGNCKRVWYRPICKPDPIKWETISETQTLEGNKKLTINSTCKCSLGGEISFIDTGANNHVDSE